MLRCLLGLSNRNFGGSGGVAIVQRKEASQEERRRICLCELGPNATFAVIGPGRVQKTTVEDG